MTPELAGYWEDIRRQLYAVTDQRNTLLQDVERLRALLREVEWGRFNADRCPMCEAAWETRHATDCRLHAALEAQP